MSDNRLSRWQRTTKVIQVVWKKWSTDYLNTLQQRGKWMIEKDNVMCGTMVIAKADFTPVCSWLLGRVVEVYHGSDGKTREDKLREQKLNVDMKLLLRRAGVLPREPSNDVDVSTEIPKPKVPSKDVGVNTF
ncbi:integrase catalytic domain-containing protein [Trichonephila clavipes]|nr:integrase catalytic domain-containing protein [Trichonephila clavipes]